MGEPIALPDDVHQLLYANLWNLYEGTQMGEPIAQDAFCTCGHRALFHEGRRLTCVMAGCQSCKGFDLAPVKAEWVETPTPTATMTVHGHSHKRMTLTVKYDTDRHFPVYLWFYKDGRPCEGC